MSKVKKCGGVFELWYAVDEDGEKWLYNQKPERREDSFWSGGYGISLEEHEGFIPDSVLPDITWKDEPIEISLLLDYDKVN